MDFSSAAPIEWTDDARVLLVPGGSRRASVRGLAGFLPCIGLLLPIAIPGAKAQTEAAKLVSIAPGETIVLHLRPREPQTLRLSTPPGTYSELRATLSIGGVAGNYIKVVTAPVPGATPDPVISDSGESDAVVPIVPGIATELDLQVTALTNSKADTAALEAKITLTASEPSPEKLLMAKALTVFNHAERLRRSHSESEAAMAAYELALSIARDLRDPALEQRVLLSSGRALMLDGKHYAVAVQKLRQAVAVSGAESAPSVQAMAWKTLGGALLNTSDYAESLAASKRALELYTTTGETFWQGVVLENMGSALLDLGDLQQALETDQRALVISRALHDDYGTVEMLAEIGSVHRIQGEYQSALNDFSEAVEVALPSAYNPMQGEAFASMGKLHVDLGEPNRARTDFQRALEIAQHTASGLDELEALENLGRLDLLHGDATAARTSFITGLARSRDLKLSRPQSALLIGLARCAVSLGDTASARPLLQQAIELSASIHQVEETAEARSVLADMAITEGQREGARAELLQAASLYESIRDRPGLAATDARMAKLEQAHGENEAALQHLSAAMDIIEGSRASLARGSLRTHYFATQRATYDQAIRLLMELDRKHPEGTFAAQAWTVAERARARSLIDELGDRGAVATSPETQALLLRLNATEVQIHTLEQRLAQAGTSAQEIEAAAPIALSLRDAIQAADELESRLRATQPIAVLATQLLTPAAFAAKTLASGDAMVEYWTGEGASFAWLITSDGLCSGFTLPAESDLQRDILSYRADLLARDVTPAAETLALRRTRLAAADRQVLRLALRLGDRLLPSSLRAALTAVERLIVIPDGPVAWVPFASLRASLPTGPGAGYLVERFELVSEPTAAYLELTRRGAARAAFAGKVAIFADPVYNLADSRLPHRAAPEDGVSARATVTPAADFSHLPRLLGSGREAAEITDVVGKQATHSFLGFEATPEAARALDWSQYTTVHFAVHSVSHRADSDDVSGILLSMFDSTGRRRDGVLWRREIYKLSIPAQLVVLSGCGTAAGESSPGEGVDSLTRAFLFSGARQVAATLWAADDTSAHLLMSGFYKALTQQKLSAPASLRAAQRAVLSRSEFQAPYFWAGFMVEGDWKTP